MSSIIRQDAVKLRQIVKAVVIDRRKLVQYVLNLDHPIGSDKAFSLQRYLGYTQPGADRLVKAIEANVLNAEARLLHTDEIGRRYQVDLWIDGKAGQPGLVCTYWLVEVGADIAELLTLHAPKAQL